LSEKGAIVFALSKSAHHLQSLRLEAAGIQTITVDLDDWNNTKEAIESIGPVDLLVNNAGIAILEPFLEVKPESFDK
jgi:L-xylulose reductase